MESHADHPPSSGLLRPEPRCWRRRAPSSGSANGPPLRLHGGARPPPICASASSRGLLLGERPAFAPGAHAGAAPEARFPLLPGEVRFHGFGRWEPEETLANAAHDAPKQSVAQCRRCSGSQGAGPRPAARCRAESPRSRRSGAQRSVCCPGAHRPPYGPTPAGWEPGVGTGALRHARRRRHLWVRLCNDGACSFETTGPVEAAVPRGTGQRTASVLLVFRVKARGAR